MLANDRTDLAEALRAVNRVESCLENAIASRPPHSREAAVLDARLRELRLWRKTLQDTAEDLEGAS